MEGETVYGHFTALAESGLTLPDNQLIPTDTVTRISLTIFGARGHRVVAIRNVDTRRGVSVPALVPGRYEAVWKLTDFNGDTRLEATRFIVQRGRAGRGPAASVKCTSVHGGRIRCTVNFPAYRQIKGKVAMRLSRGGTLVALGHGALRQGRARLTMPQLATARSGAWLATLVLSGPRIEPVTVRDRVSGF